MLYNFLAPYAVDFGILNLFNYITVRFGGALLTSLLIGLLFGGRIIDFLASKQVGVNNVREYAPESHKRKEGTPSMGGFLILLCLLPSLFLWVDWGNRFIWGLLYLTLSFSLLGFIDDYLKFSKRSGFKTLTKLFWQFIVVLPGIYLLQTSMPIDLQDVLTFPFIKGLLIEGYLFYFIFMMFVVVGSSNAVNFTDGLDGLAIGAVIVAVSAYAFIAYVSGNKIYADYLQINYIFASGEVAVFCGALIGSGLGFLWYNALPAQIFMGDTGSLPLGAALGGIAISVKHELQLLIIGFLFVLEACSVILQILSYHLSSGRYRIFAKAPLHHHFEEVGMLESKIVVRFLILCAVFALLGLATLKLR